ncbi:MAG: 6-phosphofructokinase [Deltaproteobacteria bacterium]|nr:6-phosphofructokinase [Deltaproteobacteria bacterium]
MAKPNAVYAQSGGVTSVINASAYGCIKAAMAADFIGDVLAGLDGINGVLEENLIDLSRENPADLEALRHTPAGAFGSCRKKLKDMEKDRAQFERILQVCEAHNIGYFFYDGGNDSMDTVDKLSRFARQEGSPLQVVGIPKTIDNDLPITDNSLGFASAAKYNTVSMMEGSLDVSSMFRDSTKVFILETMGRHAGWLAASTGLGRRTDQDGPHLILLPEVAFEKQNFLARVEETVGQLGYCAITVSEGTMDTRGKFLTESETTDSFGHAQLGGAGQYISELIKKDLGLKTHSAVLDYCQRSGRHVSSAVDVEQAMACGARAVALAAEGHSGVMVTIVRESSSPYRWSLGFTDAGNIANKEKKMPREFISGDGFHITDKFREYCLPLIQGEDYPPYENGLPAYRRLKKNLRPVKLPPLGAGSGAGKQS